MQIIEGLSTYNKEKETEYIESIGYFKNLRLMNYSCHKNYWCVMLEHNGKINPYDIKFVRQRDSVIPLTKYNIIVENTPFGDINLSEFKSLKNYSILETIPKNLVEYIVNL